MESVGTGDRVIAERDRLRADRDELEALRRRLRCFVNERVPVHWVRFAVFRVIDHASPSALRVMRDQMQSILQ